MKNTFLRGLKAASDVLFPRTCIVCGYKLLLDEHLLCISCMADLPNTFFWERPRNPMADRFNELIEHHRTASGNNSYEPYSFASALFFYSDDDDYRHITHHLKYKGNLEAGRYFGRMLGSRLASCNVFHDIDAVIPVPLHWTRKWKRGYNQAEVLACAIAEVLDAPLRTDILRRIRRTRTQTKLEINEKKKNVSGSFRVRQGFTDKTLRHVLIVDDVFTTGATLHACHQALRKVLGPKTRISVTTLGYVGINV